jgi:hypothetical protein
MRFLAGGFKATCSRRLGLVLANAGQLPADPVNLYMGQVDWLKNR